MLDTFSALSILSFAVGFGMMSVAGEIVPIVLGPQWHAAIPLVQWLALYGAFAGLASVLEVPMWVTGRTEVSALQAWLELVLLVPLLLLALKAFGVDGAAMARAIVAAVVLPMMLWLASRTCSLPMRDLLAALWRPLTAAIAMALLLRAPLPMPANVFGALAVKVAVGAGFYTAVLWTLWRAAGRPAGAEAALLRAAGTLIRR